MTLLPLPRPIYLDDGPDPVFATFHGPAPGAARDTAVLLCPPFAWDEVCAYRSLREWARRLAQAGYPALRVSFPSTGDSGGMPRDPDRLTAWRGALHDAAIWLRDSESPRRVVAVGIGLGGFIAHLAVSGGAAIDDLILWGTPARGHALVRQLQAFSRLEVARFFEGLPEPPPPAPGELEAGGFLLSAETAQTLDRLDLSALEMPRAPSRRVLLLERDGLAVDARLRATLQAAGAAVTVAPGTGYGAMTSHPQQARPPVEVINRVIAWLDDAAAPRHGVPDRAGPRDSAPIATTEIRLDPETAVKETVVTIPQPFGGLAGVLVEPSQAAAHGLCVVMLNAGAVRRIGPSRMWVELARQWAARGVPTLRLDVEGIGDSDGDGTPYQDDAGLYVASLVPQVLAVLDTLQARGIGHRFVLAGLCAGAYWSFHAALRDPRVCAALMVNPRALIWDTGLGPARDLRVMLSERPSWSKIRRVATRPRIIALLRWLLNAPRRWLVRLNDRRTSAAAGTELDVALEQFRALGKRGLLLFSEHEPLYDELVSTGRMATLQECPNVTVEHIKVRDHTLRPVWAQAQLHGVLDRALERELALVTVHPPATERR